MKNILIILLFLNIRGHSQKTYFVSPSGNDNGPGTISQPFKSWAKLSVLKAGDTGYIRGGTYTSPVASGAGDWIIPWQNLTGTSSNHIVISAYSGEQPVMDLTGFLQTNNTTAIRVNKCSFVDFIGLWIKNLLQNGGNIVAGWDFHECTDITLNRVWVDNIGGAGIRQSQKNGSDVITNDRFTYINCDASRCADAISTGGGAYGNADGFDCNTGTATYINCRAWWNSDDGFDTYTNDSHIYYKGCWSLRNGYIPGTYNNPGSQADGMGFKWGVVTTSQPNVVLKTYTNCLAFDNKSWGFDQNLAQCKAEFYNNTSFRNKRGGWATGYSITPRIASIFKNDASYLDPVIVSDNSGLVLSNNSWQGNAATAASFASVDTTGMTGPRDKDGNLPSLSFLKLSTASNLIDKGIDIGLPFTGTSPDLGAYEATVAPPAPVFKNVAQSKAFIKNNCTSGSGTSVVYAVAAGKYTGSTQVAADQLATNDINNNGQNFANTSGTCTPKTILKVVIYYSDGTTITQQ